MRTILFKEEKVMEDKEKKGIVELIVMGKNDMVVKLDTSEMGAGEINNIRKIIRASEQIGSNKTAGICCDGLCCDGLKGSSIMEKVVLEHRTVPVVEAIKIVETAKRIQQ